jgi:hypothetical protein
MNFFCLFVLAQDLQRRCSIRHWNIRSSKTCCSNHELNSVSIFEITSFEYHKMHKK